MNVEENRLQTFYDWPPDAAVTPERIARAGFYSLNQNLKVKCFCCGVEIAEWNYGDQVMAKHRELNPTCGFVLNSSTSGNVSNISASVQNSITEDQVDSPTSSHSLTHEAVRLQTFTNWPVPEIVSPERLARAGFYYLKQLDKTKCAFCGGVIIQWETGDDPDVEHKRHFPNCSFVLQVINPRLDCVVETDNINTFSNLTVVSQSSLDELGVNEHRGPKRTKYATLESRLRSFSTWPEGIFQTPDVLSEAGFYYEGHGDQVRCFYCDGGLRHWLRLDDPWSEHAKWFPKCGFVLLVKGQEFINACLNGLPSDSAENQRKCMRQCRRREFSDEEVEAQMLTPEVIAALGVGLHFSRIKQAIKEKLEHTGVGFSTADAVIEAALNIQLDEDHVSNPQIAEEVNQILINIVNQTLRSEEHPNENNAGVVTVENSVSEVTTPQTPNSHMLQEENRVLKEARLCKICMDNEVAIVFLPCGHLATCSNCATNLEHCPFCRSAIKATVRTFLS
ncbi:hypothetical protein FQA39_LY12718 [Lamprigera yunnana]|nr:hypothetical protein FQA39_LY12718 [Lamprigera yunnana]